MFKSGLCFDQIRLFLSLVSVETRLVIVINMAITITKQQPAVKITIEGHVGVVSKNMILLWGNPCSICCLTILKLCCVFDAKSQTTNVIAV